MIRSNNEIELLLSCSKSQLDYITANKISLLLREKIDWDWALNAALHHGIWPILYHNLKTVYSEAVPQDVLSKLQRVYLFNAVRNLQLTNELLQIIKDFQTHGIKVVPFKGPVLAQAIYGDIALRSFCDLDIMVKKQDVLKAKDLMISRGYQSTLKLTPSLEKTYLQSACEYNFTRSNPSIWVEIHWNFHPNYFSIPFDEEIWSRLETMNLEGATVNRFPAEDLILALCGHATRHQWGKIKLVSDIAGLLECYHIDWERVKRNAADMDLMRILHIGLFLAHDLLDVEFPVKMQNMIENDSAAKKLALNLSKKLLNCEFNRQERSFETVLFWLSSREKLLVKARFLFIVVMKRRWRRFLIQHDKRNM